MLEYLQNVSTWIYDFSQEYHTYLAMTMYGGFSLLILGSIFRNRFIVYLETSEHDKIECEEEEYDIEIEVKYLSEKVKFLEELFSTLNSSYLDSTEENKELFKSLKESKYNISLVIDSQNKVIISHGNVLSRILEEQSLLKDKVENQRIYLHELIGYIKQQETEIQLLNKNL